MNLSFWCAWYVVGGLTGTRLTAAESAALVMVAASLLVFRTFRERYLLLWTLGWLALFVSRWALRDAAIAGREMVAVSQATFVVAVSLFAATVQLYSRTRKWLLGLAIVGFVLAYYAAVRAYFWPDIVVLRIVLELGYRAVALATSIIVIR